MSRILVIDDEDSIRKLLKTVLTRKGHDVLLAECGQKSDAATLWRVANARSSQ